MPQLPLPHRFYSFEDVFYALTRERPICSNCPKKSIAKTIKCTSLRTKARNCDSVAQAVDGDDAENHTWLYRRQCGVVVNATERLIRILARPLTARTITKGTIRGLPKPFQAAGEHRDDRCDHVVATGNGHHDDWAMTRQVAIAVSLSEPERANSVPFRDRQLCVFGAGMRGSHIRQYGSLARGVGCCPCLQLRLGQRHLLERRRQQHPTKCSCRSIVKP